MCNIMCIQLRRISVMAVAERVAEERVDRLGRIVGYQIRLEKVQVSVFRIGYNICKKVWERVYVGIV